MIISIIIIIIINNVTILGHVETEHVVGQPLPDADAFRHLNNNNT